MVWFALFLCFTAMMNAVVGQDCGKNINWTISNQEDITSSLQTNCTEVSYIVISWKDARSGDIVLPNIQRVINTLTIEATSSNIESVRTPSLNAVATVQIHHQPGFSVTDVELGSHAAGYMELYCALLLRGSGLNVSNIRIPYSNSIGMASGAKRVRSLVDSSLVDVTDDCVELAKRGVYFDVKNSTISDIHINDKAVHGCTEGSEVFHDISTVATTPIPRLEIRRVQINSEESAVVTNIFINRAFQMGNIDLFVKTGTIKNVQVTGRNMKRTATRGELFFDWENGFQLTEMSMSSQENGLIDGFSLTHVEFIREINTFAFGGGKIENVMLGHAPLRQLGTIGICSNGRGMKNGAGTDEETCHCFNGIAAHISPRQPAVVDNMCQTINRCIPCLDTPMSHCLDNSENMTERNESFYVAKQPLSFADDEEKTSTFEFCKLDDQANRICAYDMCLDTEQDDLQEECCACGGGSRVDNPKHFMYNYFQVPGCCQDKDHNRPLRTLVFSSVASVELCYFICDTNEKCEAFEYYANNGECGIFYNENILLVTADTSSTRCRKTVCVDKGKLTTQTSSTSSVTPGSSTSMTSRTLTGSETTVSSHTSTSVTSSTTESQTNTDTSTSRTNTITESTMSSSSTTSTTTATSTSKVTTSSTTLSTVETSTTLTTTSQAMLSLSSVPSSTTQDTSSASSTSSSVWPAVGAVLAIIVIALIVAVIYLQRKNSKPDDVKINAVSNFAVRSSAQPASNPVVTNPAYEDPMYSDDKPVNNAYEEPSNTPAYSQVNKPVDENNEDGMYDNSIQDQDPTPFAAEDSEGAQIESANTYSMADPDNLGETQTYSLATQNETPTYELAVEDGYLDVDGQEI
eukprot:m.8530 g.8530  ORF g.8530 m.8530 type:complete len:862 (+) comp3912_c0_seq1:111-2696(+)